MSRLGLLFSLGIRNLMLHKVASLVVGLLLFFASFLLVFGGAMVQSVRASMERSVTNSLSGQLQLVDAQGREELSLFPSGASGTLDYGEIPDFPALQELVLDVPGVRDVVPMGLQNAIVLGRTEMDRLVEALRASIAQGSVEQTALLKREVQALGKGFESDIQASMVASRDPSKERGQLQDLERLQDESFWSSLGSDPEGTLGFVESRIAPLASDGRSYYLRLIGTNLAEYPKAFDRFRVVDGEIVPEGARGLLLSKSYYEGQVKNEVARSLDRLNEALVDGGSIAEDTLLQEEVRRMGRQSRRVLFQIPIDEVEAVRAELSKALGQQAELDALLLELLNVNDQNFQARYALFYELIAPRIRLYEFAVGDTVTLRTFTRSGYARATNVKLYGTFTFSGLEASDLAGANQLVDLVSFRELYGRMTQAQKGELEEIRASAGLAELSRESAEDALFGGDSPLVMEAPVAAPVALPSREVQADKAPSPDERDDGLVLNAAVLLKEGARSRAVAAEIQRRLDNKGMTIEVIDWKKAAGLLGQLVSVIQVVIYTGIFIIFLVALAIINNTMMMSAMQRRNEIGTLRAIGTQRSQIIGMFLVETVLLGLIAGGLGALAGVAAILLLGQIGIPAMADILVLIFAGPRLYPTVGALEVLPGLLTVLVFAVISALQPTLLAARVSPVVAMAQKE